MIRTTRRRHWIFVLAGGLGAQLAAASAAVAQVEADPFRSVQASAIGIEFNFSNPGARSLAMGGAFVGRADDATAAYANPAGLVQLREPELSLEVRSWQVPVTLSFPTQELEETTRGVSFASYVHPRGRWTLALYRHEQADYDIEATPPTSTRIELTGHALAAAYRFDSGLSLGAAIVVYDGSLEGVAGCQTLSGPCQPPGQVIVDRADGTEVSGNLGLLWQVNPRWSLGAVYRRHSSYDVTSQQLAPGEPPRDLPEYTLRIPDVLGLGAGWRASSRLVLNFDFVRVRNSQSLEEVGSSRVISDPQFPDRVIGEFLLEDVDELHFGLEYSFWNVRGAPALRFGAWYDPAHRLEFVAAGDVDCVDSVFPGDQVACLLAEQFTGGDDRLHVSAGFGLVLGRRFQLDAGADVSDETETFSLSILARF